MKTRTQSLEDAMAYIFLPFLWYCAIANTSTQPSKNSDNQAYSARKCQAGVFFSWVCSQLPIVDPHSESPGHVNSFAKIDQRVESVKHRWVCCWLLAAGCWLLVAGPPSTLSSLVLGHQQPRQRVWPLREVALGASLKFRWCIIPCTLPWHIIPCGTSGAAGTSSSRKLRAA